MFRIAADADFCSAASEIMPAFSAKAAALSPVWSGRAGGAFRPSWWSPDIEIPAQAFTLFTADDVFYAPQLGILATDDGRISRLCAQQAAYADPEWAGLSALWGGRNSAPILERASIIIPWGAATNYGHFLLDALTSAPYLTPPLVTPPLRPWQRQHFDALQLAPRELDAQLYRVGKAAFTSGFGQNLHNPNLHFLSLRRLQHTMPSHFGRKLYISRKGHRRPFKSEDMLIGELARRGFTVIQPETLSVSEQIGAFRGADLIVAPKGSALANCLYCTPGATVIEITPRDLTRYDNSHKWAGYLLALAGCDWRPYFCENDQGDEAMPLIGNSRRAGFLSFDVVLADLLAFVDETLWEKSTNSTTESAVSVQATAPIGGFATMVAHDRARQLRREKLRDNRRQDFPN
jgi:capsular polysaccharide biosynthesis protein